MGVTVATPAKGRLETIEIEITKENTTWFDSYEDSDVYSITDWNGCLLVTKVGYYYPILIYNVTRQDVDYDHDKAKKMMQTYCEDMGVL